MLTEKQKEQRRNGLGGTDIGAILGFSQYSSPIRIYKEKIGIAPDRKDNKQMRVGRAMEDGIIKLYEEDQNCKVIVCDTVHHPKYDFLFANVDGKIDNTNIILECKTAYKTAAWGDPGTNQIPDIYLFQVAHYANITDAEKVDIAVLFIESRNYEIYTYQRNVELEAILEERAIKFWNENVLKRVAPDPINAEDCKKLYKTIKSEAKIATPLVKTEIRWYKSIKNQINELKKEETRRKDKLIVYMEGNERLINADGITLATYRERKGSSYFDTDGLKETNPDLFEKYQSRRESTRTFRAK